MYSCAMCKFDRSDATHAKKVNVAHMHGRLLVQVSVSYRIPMLLVLRVRSDPLVPISLSAFHSYTHF